MLKCSTYNLHDKHLFKACLAVHNDQLKSHPAPNRSSSVLYFSVFKPILIIAQKEHQPRKMSGLHAVGFTLYKTQCSQGQLTGIRIRNMNQQCIICAFSVENSGLKCLSPSMRTYFLYYCTQFVTGILSFRQGDQLCSVGPSCWILE